MVSSSGGGGRRVLIVDDDEEIRSLLSTVLGMRGLQVDCASDGVEAVDLITQNRYAVVLLDLIMPVADGYMVLDRLRGLSPVAVPVVLVVTGADRREIEQLDASVIHGIVRKPFDADDLALLVLSCVDIRDRSAFETMVAAVVAGAPWIGLLQG